MTLADAHMLVVHAGRTSYTECWALQQFLLEHRLAGGVPDLLLLTEHDHVYTIGTAGGEDHLLWRDDALRERGIAVVRTDRGGDITYHGPGQLVAYPIIDLHGFTCDLHRYLRDLEETVIRTLRRFGIRGERAAGYTGVWVGGDKICAIGVRSRGWVTMHGLALNVTTDLDFYRGIIPCGIFERGVTSMHEILGRPLGLPEVEKALAEELAGVFAVAPPGAGVRNMNVLTGEEVCPCP